MVVREDVKPKISGSICSKPVLEGQDEIVEPGSETPDEDLEARDVPGKSCRWWLAFFF
jgi:hypothetical protein